MEPKDRFGPTIEWEARCDARILVGFTGTILIHPPEGMPGDVPIYHHSSA
jgi:hypothetical protein